jgi:hypothetical protein
MPCLPYIDDELKVPMLYLFGGYTITLLGSAVLIYFIGHFLELTRRRLHDPLNHAHYTIHNRRGENGNEFGFFYIYNAVNVLSVFILVVLSIVTAKKIRRTWTSSWFRHVAYVLMCVLPVFMVVMWGVEMNL